MGKSSGDNNGYFGNNFLSSLNSLSRVPKMIHSSIASQVCEGKEKDIFFKKKKVTFDLYVWYFQSRVSSDYYVSRNI